MSEFVAHTAAAGVTPTIARHSYAKLGKSHAFEAQPAVLHFGGYKLNKVHTQKLRLVNRSDRSQRVHIIVPTTPYFKAKYDKKGLVAPGMAEEVTIEFMPTEWRYYYDCVRLHSEKENLLIPIHAYPVMNEVVFPTRIDFGICPLSETATRRVTFECKVPIQFEYELEVVEYHPDFSISPTSGIVPANGTTSVTIDFTPVKLTVARMAVLVKISQFGFKPFKCEIVGSAAAGMTREAAMTALYKEIASKSDSPRAPSLVMQSTTRHGSPKPNPELRAGKVTVPRIGVGSGAAFDPGCTAVEQRTLRRRAKARARTKKLAAMDASSSAAGGRTPGGRTPSARSVGGKSARGGAAETPETNAGALATLGQDTMIDGVRVPAHLAGVPAANFILTQAPGKMKPKDLAAAIQQQNEQRTKQKAAQEQLRATLAATGAVVVGTAPGPGLTVRAMLAEEGVQDLEIDEEPGVHTLGEGRLSQLGETAGSRPGTGASLLSPSPGAGAGAGAGWGDDAAADKLRVDTVVARGNVTFADVEGDELEELDVDDEAPDPSADKPVRGSAEDPRRLKEMVFLQDVGEIDAAERQREFQSASEWVGEVDMTGDEVEEVMVVRIKVRNKQEAATRDVERRSYTTRVKGPHQVIPTTVSALVRGKPAKPPTYDPYANDVWRKRRQVLLRLRTLVTQSIVRKRADTRLALLQRRIADAAARGPEGMRELVERDHRMAATGGGLAATTAITPGVDATAGAGAGAGVAVIESPYLEQPFAIDVERMQRVTFPEVTLDGEGGGGTTLVDAPTPYDFQDLGKLKMVEPPEHEVMDYKEVPVPVHPSYTPLETDRALREGALEENTVREADVQLDPRLSRAAATAELAAPKHIMEPLPLPASLQPLLPDPVLRPHLPLEDVTEIDPYYYLQPAVQKPFSLQPWSRPPPPPPPPAAGDDDEDDTPAAGAGAGAGAGGGGGAGAAEEEDLPRDLNGLVVTESQAASNEPRSWSLRALRPHMTLSELWRPRRERLDPQYERPHPWLAPQLPELLQGPVSDDDLSDDSESDDEEVEGSKPTWEDAMTVFVPKDEAAGEAGGEEAKGAAGDDAAAPNKDLGDVAAAAGQATEIPRDRARLALAAIERRRNDTAVQWLDKRLRHIDELIQRPQDKLAFDAIPRIHW